VDEYDLNLKRSFAIHQAKRAKQKGFDFPFHGWILRHLACFYEKNDRGHKDRPGFIQAVK
jgi:hypothetical protein